MNLGFETESIEFKKTTGELKEGIISLTSMLNKNGYATLYFGVRNDGEAVGQEIGDKTLRDVSHAISLAVKPQIIPSVSLELLDDKNVIKVTAEGAEKPYSAYGRYYIRIADEDTEMSPEQLMRFMQEKENADVITKIEAENQNLSFNQLKTLFSGKGLTLNDGEFEKNLGFLTPNGAYNFLAELLADQNDVSIKVVKFAGTDKSTIVRRNEYGFKCLALALTQVLTYMEAINDTKVTLGTPQRIEEKLFDFDAFKEAWQNACLHTKWQRKNPPAVYIFSDRIEVISTGGLTQALSKEEFFRGISHPVNAKLQKIFGQLGFVEQTGHGIPLIINRYGTQAFEVMDNFLNVTIPFNNALVEKPTYGNIQEKMFVVADSGAFDNAYTVYDKVANKVSYKIPPRVSHNIADTVSAGTLNRSQKKILAYFKSNPYATADEAAPAIPCSVANVRKVIMQLKEFGLLKRVGSNKAGYWQVQEKGAYL